MQLNGKGEAPLSRDRKCWSYTWVLRPYIGILCDKRGTQEVS